MKKQELRACFDRIRPSEALIDATLVRVREKQAEIYAPAYRMPRYAFVTRLASAACALLLLVGIGVAVGKDAVRSPAVLPENGDRSVTPMTADMKEPTGGEVQPLGEGGALAGCEAMIETAAAFGTDYAVFDAAVEAMYFVSETEGVALLRPGAVAAQRVEGEQPGWPDEGEETLAVHVDLTVAERQDALLNAVGGSVLVGIHAEVREDETVWVLHELYPEAVAEE